MLQNLHVKNLALIDETEVEFSEGLNILSGETGAGKSIIIGSVSLALGEKVPKELLRDNGDTALVELVFHVDDPKVLAAVAALDIEVEDDTVILTRKISSGRSIARINGEAVSVSKLKEAAALLIDIHGQHEHQSLLHRRRHLEILDAYARDALSDRPARLLACYQEYRKLKEEWENSRMDSEERARELSFLTYEVNEIEQAQLREGEDEELESLFRRISNGKKILDAAGQAYAAVDGEEPSASSLVAHALRELGQVSRYDGKVAQLESQLLEIDSLLSDFAHETAAYLSNEEFDDETYYMTKKRLDELNHLKSKYGGSVEEILSACREKSERIAVLNDYDQYLEKLSRKFEKKKAELEKLCAQVSKIRRQESKKLVNAIRLALSDLNFLDVAFEISFEETKDFTAHGRDEAEFLISTNPGEPVRPLGKVASGGELSRVMLAIKTVLAESDAIETLIFDEIDTGISGRTAQMVSEKMKLLGKSHQIICITHLPQIAAMADTHFLIEKSVENRSTSSHIYRLNEEASVRELARMLGGVEITDTVMQSAREMKALAAGLGQV